MAKFYGAVGYSTGQVESVPGVWEDGVVERMYYGDVVRNTRQLRADDEVNSDISVGNSISILADAYAHQHFFAMRYISWAGVLWSVEEVDVQSPRLVLRLGGVYHGPTA